MNWSGEWQEDYDIYKTKTLIESFSYKEYSFPHT